MSAKPKQNYSSNGTQFPSAWFTWKLGLPADLNYAEIGEAKRLWKERNPLSSMFRLGKAEQA